jgi:hypothetical protein
MAVMDSSADIVVGCIAGLSFEQIAPWVNSLERCGFEGRRVVIHLRTDPETIAELNRRGCETYDASILYAKADQRFKKNSDPEEISVNRFFYIWYFLSQIATGRPVRYLIATDVTDVLFQRNPSEWLERNLGDKRLLVGCESLPFEAEPWGAETMKACFGPHVWEAWRNNLIYNAGTIAGEFQTLVDVCLQVYFLAPGDRVLYSDQQALNLLLGSQVYREITLFASSEDGWACQAGTTADPKLLLEVRERLTGPEPTFDGEFVRTAAGEIFTIVHQYNRVPGWDTALKMKYGKLATAAKSNRGTSWLGRLIPGGRP